MNRRGAAPSVAGRLLATCLSLLAARADDTLNRGQADVGFQGYYLGESAQALYDTSGTALHFTDLMPAVGVWTGSIELYGQQGGFQPGNNFVRISDMFFAGRRWTATAGDFVTSIGAEEALLPGIVLPAINARGYFVESVHGQESWSIFGGRETLILGPGIPLRAPAPQSVFGAAWKRTFAQLLQVNGRLLNFSSSEAELARSALLFPGSSGYRDVTTGTVGTRYRPFRPLRLSAEASQSRSAQFGGAAHFAPSLITGLVLETGQLHAAASYVDTSATWLPLAGYYLGARRGGFGDFRYRPFRRLGFSADGGSSTNAIGNGGVARTFRTDSASAGISAILPEKINASADYSQIRIDVPPGGDPDLLSGATRQTSVSLDRTFGRHSIRTMVRKLDLAIAGAPQAQLTREVQDIVTLRRLIIGGAARFDTISAGAETRNSIFARGMVQLRMPKVNVFANIESGHDLLDRTVFAATNVRTSEFGATARVREWELQGQVYRNTLVTQLNAENAVVIQDQNSMGEPVLAALNRWTCSVSLKRSFQWRGGLPERDVGDTIRIQRAILGSIAGAVLAGTVPAIGIPVVLDGGRTAVTDGTGRFRFEGVPEGRHAIALAEAGLPAQFNPGRVSRVQLDVVGRRPAAVSLDVVRLGMIRGRVMAPASITLDTVVLRLLPGTRYTTAGADGRFAFYNVRAGTYDIVLDRNHVPDNAEVQGPFSFHIDFDVDTAPALPVFELGEKKSEKPVRRIILAP
ncbi:MAG TPA: hypothetical protein VFA04_15470 [Bryobacteraceae bacterium]|nr:hypothetical protein [Bryobacteraceae bacterium]